MRFHDHAMQVEGQQGLHVDAPRPRCRPRRAFGSFQGDAHAGAVGDQGEVVAWAQDFGHSQGQGELADIVGQALLEAIAIEHLHHQGGVIGLKRVL